MKKSKQEKREAYNTRMSDRGKKIGIRQKKHRVAAKEAGTRATKRAVDNPGVPMIKAMSRHQRNLVEGAKDHCEGLL